jgi:ribosomal protein S18 acetylase RimI-like enzyme
MSGRDQSTLGAIQAYTLGIEPVAPLHVAGVRFIQLHPGLIDQLAEAMQVSVAELYQRRALGNRAALALLDDDTIAGYGWVSYDSIRIIELDLELAIPRGHAYIWDCATIPQYRGRGIFPGLLRFMLEELRLRGVTQVWAAVAPGNDASLRSFTRAGFRLVAHSNFGPRHFEAYPTDVATPNEAAVLHALTTAP